MKVPARLGELVLRRLGDKGGAVIRDSWSGHLYWLVAAGSAANWRLPGVVVLGVACYVAVPPAHRTYGPGPHWAVPPSGGRELTDAGALHGALTYALGARETS